MDIINSAINRISENKNITTTENGATAFNSTGDCNLDLFFKLIRNTECEKINDLFYKAWLEDPETAVKILLNSRDCRHGKGEKLIVLYALQWLRKYKPCTYLKNILLFLEVGYYRDLLQIVKYAEMDGQPVLGTNDMIELELFANKLKEDEVKYSNQESISLAAKWAPTECHKDDREYEFARRIARILYPGNKITHSLKLYRQLLTKLRKHIKVVESKMAHNEWNEIEYSTVPSKSHKLHTAAFKRHDLERYEKYIEDLKQNKTTIKSTGLQPHELTNASYNSTIQMQWDDMITKLKETSKLGNVLPLCDVSSSMSGMPMDVCIALGLVITELVEGPFKDKVLTFETNPNLITIKGKQLNERVRELRNASWGGSTNLTAAFEQILSYAVMMNCTQEQLPKTLIIFSDMQFDHACNDVSNARSKTVFQDAKDKFEAEGYKLPSVIFWNLRDTASSFPVTKDENGVALISGYSAEVLKVIMKDPEDINPIRMMMTVLEQYKNVVINESEIGPIKELNYEPFVYKHDSNIKKKKLGKGPGSVRRKSKNENLKTDSTDYSQNSDSDSDSDSDISPATINRMDKYISRIHCKRDRRSLRGGRGRYGFL